MTILYHYTARYNESIYTAKEYITNWTVRVSWRSLAVCTFFLLSGYISGIYRMGSALEYLRKRLIRIWLTFMLCCTLTSICMELVYQQAFVAWKMTMEELLCQYILGILKIQAYYILKKVMEKYWAL